MMLRLIHNMRFSLKLHTQYLLPHAMPNVMQMLDGAVSERSVLDWLMGVQGSSLSTLIELFRFKMLSGCGEVLVLKHKALSSVLRNIWALFYILVIQMLGRWR